MDLRHLRTFAAIARTRHLGRAAELLQLSQPAVSGHLKALEDDLAVVLFDRGPRGMQLSPAGEALLPAAERAIAAADEVAQVASTMTNTVVGAVTVGIVSQPEWLRVGRVLGHLLERHPRLGVTLRQGLSGELVAAVRDGRLDATWAVGRIDDARLSSRRLDHIVLRVVGPRAWHDRLQTGVAADILKLPWVRTPPLCSYHRAMEDFFVEAGGRPTHLVEADQEPTLRSLVAAGAGLTLLREATALQAEAAGEISIWSGPARQEELRFVVSAARLADPAISAVRDAVAAAWS